MSGDRWSWYQGLKQNWYHPPLYRGEQQNLSTKPKGTPCPLETQIALIMLLSDLFDQWPIWPQLLNMFLHWPWLWTPAKMRWWSIKCPGLSQLQGIHSILYMMLLKSNPLKTLQSKRQGFKLTEDQNCINSYLWKLQEDVSTPCFFIIHHQHPCIWPQPYLLLYRRSKLAFLNHVENGFAIFIVLQHLQRDNLLCVWLPGKIFLGCLDKDWYPNSATGIGRKAKTNVCFQGGGCCITYTKVMFLLSVVCNHFIRRNKDVFCMSGTRKIRVGSFHSCVYLGVSQTPGHFWAVLCGLDKSTSAMTSCSHAGWLFMYWQDHQWSFVCSALFPLQRRVLCIWKQHGHQEWMAVSQGASLLSMHRESVTWRPRENALIRQSGCPGHSIFLMSPRDAGYWPQGYTVRNKGPGNCLKLNKMIWLYFSPLFSPS